MGNMNRPGSVVVGETDHDPFTVDGVQYFIRELHWNDISGRSYDLYTVDGEIVNDGVGTESWDDYPTDTQIRAQISAQTRAAQAHRTHPPSDD